VETKHWVPADKWAKADHTPSGFNQGDHIVKAHFILLGQSTMLSDVGLTMGDALKKAFTTTGRVHCGFSDKMNWTHKRATMQDVFDVVKKKLGVESAPKISYMHLHLQLRLWLVGSHALLFLRKRKELLRMRIGSLRSELTMQRPDRLAVLVCGYIKTKNLSELKRVDAAWGFWKCYNVYDDG
jgi:hypothetical protein